MSSRLTQIISELPIVNFDITFSQLAQTVHGNAIADVIKDYPELSYMTIRNYLKYEITHKYFRGGNIKAYRSDSE